MAFDNSFTAVTGATYTAAQYNTYTKGNFTAVWVYTTAGDIAYATSSSALSRLGIGANNTVLLSNGTAPSWSHSPAIAGVLHATAEVDFYPNGQSTTSTTYQNVTGGTVNITTTVTCTIMMYSYGMIASLTAGIAVFVRGSINGTVDTPTYSSSLPRTSQGYYVPYGYLYKLAGVGAGTITCLMQFRSGSAGQTVYYDAGSIIALAFAE